MSLTRMARRRAFQIPTPAQAAWPEDHPRPAARFTPEGSVRQLEIEAYFEGEPDKEHGMIANLAQIDELLSEVLAPFQASFEGEPDALANRIAAEIIAQKDLPRVRLIKVRLHVTPDFWVDVWP